MQPSLRYDRQADALYVTFANKPRASGKEIDLERHVDYAADGTVIGVEITCASEGVDLHGLPHAETIAKLLNKAEVPVLA